LSVFPTAALPASGSQGIISARLQYGTPFSWTKVTRLTGENKSELLNLREIL